MYLKNGSKSMQCYTYVFAAILEAFMMVFLAMKLSLWVFVKVSKIIVAFINFGQVTLVIFLILCNLKLSSSVSLLTLSKSGL